jgi:signal transduction histidine kinase
MVTVLNVNDDAANRYAISRMLRLGELSVTEAATGTEALEKVRSERPDVVVLDVNLPDLSGHDVCARIKSDPVLCRISVLQLSAISVRSSDRVAGLDAGADAYLTMPVEPAVLLATVRALLRMRRAEEASRLAAARWGTTFDAISEGVALLDAGGSVLQMNRAMAALLPPGTPSTGPYRAVLGAVFGLEELPLEEHFTSDARQIRELAFGDRWLRIVSDPILEEGAVRGRVLTFTDLSERRRLEDDLRQHVTMLADTDRRKDEFLAMLGHELRNPLSAISAALYNLNQPEEQADPKWLREVASRQVEQLSRLVDDLLDVSRITKGKIRLRREPMDLRQTIRDVERATRPLIEECRQELRLVLPAEPLVVNGDPTRLEQVVSNLVNNASKYTPAGGSLSIIAEGTDSEVIVRVEDSGIGVAPELLPKIFDLFTQGEQTIDRPTGGLGIGLTVVRTLVQLHSGSVQASSAGPGRGSQFTIRLPRMFMPVDAGNAGVWIRSVPGAGGGLRILVAEDNADVRELMRVMLERRGHSVTAVDNGESAVESALAAPPDVGLIDLGLPLADGYEVARRIHAAHPDIRLIAVSGYGRDDDIDRSRKAGFETHLVKPVRPPELFEAING